MIVWKSARRSFSVTVRPRAPLRSMRGHTASAMSDSVPPQWPMTRTGWIRAFGAIPAMLDTIGISYDFFGPGKALFTLALIDVWQWTPFMVLLLLAGLESIPKEPLDAARVDGAGGLYVLRRITLPLLAPVLVVAILLRSLDAMKVFEYVFATTRGGPGTETETLQYFIYQTGIQFFRLGSASSMAFVVLVVVLAVIVFAFRRMDKARTAGSR